MSSHPQAFAQLRVRLQAKLTTDGRDYNVILSRIGEESAQITTNYNFSAGKSFLLSCEMLPGHAFRAEGVIGVNHKAPGDVKQQIIDLRFTRVRAMAKVVLHEYFGHTHNRRREPRHKADFPIRMLHPTGLANLEAANLSMTGLFVVTDIPVPAETFIRLELTLDKRLTVILDARVVYLIDRVMAQKINRPAGFGVEILHMQTIDRQNLQQHLHSLDH